MERTKLFNKLYVPITGRKIAIVFSIISILLWQPGCKKFVQVAPPTTELVNTSVYSNAKSAAEVLNGIYAYLVTQSNGTDLSAGLTSIGYLCGLSGDELTNYSANPTISLFYKNSYSSTNINTFSFWFPIYQELYVCNAAIEGLTNSKSISVPIKNQLLGEAKFLRAFFLFYATNLYGNVPLDTTTDYQTNATIKRYPQSQINQQIISDLQSAKILLSSNFVDQTNTVTDERIRPNKGAAAALLARQYLYMGNWADAVAQSDSVINNTTLYSLDALNDVFLMNSSEAIWQLQSITPGWNTFDAQVYVLTSRPGVGRFLVSLSPNVLNAFETGDNRKNDWVGSYKYPPSGVIYYYANKYKVGSYSPNAAVTEYTMVLRLGEQYLIRAEAAAQQNNLTSAANDLNTIRIRAGLDSTNATSQADLLSAIYHERQVELFTEWGHRWFDLQRTGKIDSVMTAVSSQKKIQWDKHLALFPIPLPEIMLDANLTQNPGYN
jgi:hypothetical protein